MMSQLFAQIYRASCSNAHSVIGSATILVWQPCRRDFRGSVEMLVYLSWAIGSD